MQVGFWIYVILLKFLSPSNKRERTLFVVGMCRGFSSLLITRKYIVTRPSSASYIFLFIRIKCYDLLKVELFA